MGTMAGMDPALIGQSEAYLDAMFGPGHGKRHTEFLEHIENLGLRETLHRYHAMESDTRWISVEDNYLLGMCVLCSLRSYGPAAMFAKTLIHLGVPREKVLEAAARLTMWVGGIQAAEASAHLQKAILEYERTGLASMGAWFPPVASAENGR